MKRTETDSDMRTQILRRRYLWKDEKDRELQSICTVSQMARKLGLSRARLYQLIEDGVFRRLPSEGSNVFGSFVFNIDKMPIVAKDCQSQQATIGVT